MSWYDNKTDFWHLVGDPGGYVSGVNKGGFKGVLNMAKGDPDSAKAAYDAQIEASKQSQAQLQSFLMSQKANAQGLYSPVQHMFSSYYGTDGVQAPQVPQSTQPTSPAQPPRRGAFSGAYGGK